MTEAQMLQSILVLPVSSIEETTAWYQETFGFEVQYLHEGDHPGEATNYAIMRRDGALVHFILDENLPGEPRWTKAGTGYFYLIVSDVDAVYHDVKNRGIRITRELQTEIWGARAFNLVDPSGNDIHVEQAM